MRIVQTLRWFWLAWKFPPPTLIDQNGTKRYCRPLWISKRREISLDIRIKPKEKTA
jgi:hypothetical protein